MSELQTLVEAAGHVNTPIAICAVAVLIFCWLAVRVVDRKPRSRLTSVQSYRLFRLTIQLSCVVALGAMALVVYSPRNETVTASRISASIKTPPTPASAVSANLQRPSPPRNLRIVMTP